MILPKSLFVIGQSKEQTHQFIGKKTALPLFSKNTGCYKKLMHDIYLNEVVEIIWMCYRIAASFVDYWQDISWEQHSVIRRQPQ